VTGPARPCDAAGPHTPGPVRPFACGWRCPAHTPAALAGKPEAPEPKPNAKEAT
jgi:hypothetical protein